MNYILAAATLLLAAAWAVVDRADSGPVLGYQNPIGLHMRPDKLVPALHVPFGVGKLLMPWRIRIQTGNNFHLPVIKVGFHPFSEAARYNGKPTSFPEPIDIKYQPPRPEPVPLAEAGGLVQGLGIGGPASHGGAISPYSNINAGGPVNGWVLF